MPRLSIFSRLELASPVFCEAEGCEADPFNIVFFPMNEEDLFYESFGNGGEDEENDKCKKCKSLGTLGEPFAYFFYSLCDNDNHVVALKMSLDTIESLTRSLKNAQEEDSIAHEKVYLAADPMCDCFDDFHVFQIGMDGDFNDGSWDFDLHPFNERNKVVIVGKEGVCLSCDISIKGDGDQEMGTIRSCWLDLQDLAELNGWITKRVGIRN